MQGGAVSPISSITQKEKQKCFGKGTSEWAVQSATKSGQARLLHMAGVNPVSPSAQPPSGPGSKTAHRMAATAPRLVSPPLLLLAIYFPYCNPEGFFFFFFFSKSAKLITT